MTDIYGIRDFIDQCFASFDQGKSVQLTGSTESFTQFSVIALSKVRRIVENKSKIIIVLPTLKELTSWTTILEFLCAQDQGISLAAMPFTNCWGMDRFTNQALTRQKRIAALTLLSDPCRRSGFILTTLHGLGQLSLSAENFCKQLIKLNVSDIIEPDDLAFKLKNYGYLQVNSVQEQGCFALRGAIFDIAPLNYEFGIRLEFFTDKITSIRKFSLTDQRSYEELDYLEMPAALELKDYEIDHNLHNQRLYDYLLTVETNKYDRDGLLSAFESKQGFSLLDLFLPILRGDSSPTTTFLKSNDLLIFPKTIESCFQEYERFFKNAEDLYDKDIEFNRVSVPPKRHFLDSNSLKMIIDNHKNRLEFGNPFSNKNCTFLQVMTRQVVDHAQIFSQYGKDAFEKWFFILQNHLKNPQNTLIILAHTAEQLDRVEYILSHRNIHSEVERNLLPKLAELDFPKGHVVLGIGHISSHLLLEDHNLMIVSEEALFGPRKAKPKSVSDKLKNLLSSFKDLKVGDLVVHINHGIGRYQGMKTLSIGGIESDFLYLGYSEGDRVYLPIDRLNLLQKYTTGGGEHAAAALDKLKGLSWDKRKTRAKKAIKDMAAELLKIQAQRKLADHHIFGLLTEEYFRFEADFPYEETEDQLRAIADVNADLSAPAPMDRLICGDVGFGKTEIALRAALRAVLEGFQVVVLVPTTVLCYQHYKTFSERLNKFGVKVASINRFNPAKSTKAILSDLKSGKVDVIIGTHRILSKDIHFKHLGLLVIDEEQRFGVVHKERIKELKAGIDLISMTATPIPRTLHMAMLGLRDISIIATPPVDRLSVRTYIAKFDQSLIVDAINQELNRGGQVFFVHNRVEDIVEMKNFLQKSLPNIEIRIAHGQMPGQQLENIIIDFVEQKFSVLLCTTIIESGVDMPNVNTLIVNRSDMFGLAQLYQLRGRVGRSNRQAYAYFLTPTNEIISDEAQRRLEVISTHQELGSGFQIASHDLEIRGAGNLLGAEQSGFVSEIGLELYTDMLENTIKELRGQPFIEKIDTEIKIPITALFPKQYIALENERLHLYKRLFSVESDQEWSDLLSEIKDRYGKPPKEAQTLFQVAKLKRLLTLIAVKTISKVNTNHYELKFGSLKLEQINALIKFVVDSPRQLALTPDYKLLITLSKAGHMDEGQNVEELIKLIYPLALNFEVKETQSVPDKPYILNQ